MPAFTRDNRKVHLRRAILIASLALPATLNAQQAGEIEEVVVTGSYIKNSKFAQNSPVDSVSAEDLMASGQPSMANYIRDLTYTQNSNTVNNVNASNSGSQTGFGTTFNLRGLGENSTLTLVDGVRSIDSAVSNLLPEIAISRMEVVLDGGSALYGSDAVAGVVNLIPIKRYEGFRTRVYYQQDEGGDFSQPSIGMLFGKSFDNGVDWVLAGDYRRSTPLMNYERPRTLRADYGWANSGSPGVWKELDGATVNPGGPHGGEQVGDPLRDPSCGTFNDVTDLGEARNNPSGIPIGENDCYFTYSAQWPLSDGKTEYNIYNNLTWMVNSQLELEATVNYTWREMESRNSGTYQQNANNRTALIVPADHPANPYGVDVGPHLWRPFAVAGTLPSHFENESGARLQPYQDTIQRYKIGARYEISSTWSAYTYYSMQETERERDEKMINMPRLAAALAGQGGPTGDQWFNPFGSADPRSPYYEEGVTNNSQELVDWIAPSISGVSSDGELDIFEVTASGEIFDMPYGPAMMATGYQHRKSEQGIYHNPLSLIGHDYNTSIADSPPRNDSYSSKVHAAFMEFELPLLETLSAQVAVRHERFTSFDLETTTPKVALRWEALPSLALRTSWGESFLAPTAADIRPFDPNEGCGEIFFGGDPLTGGVLNGGATCASGNPDLQPETSEIWNVGFTWEPLDALSVSLDYQTLEYTDRIRTMNHVDMVGIEFTEMLNAIGATASTYDPTPGSATREAANDWLAAGGYDRVQRDPASQRVTKVVRQAQNVSSVWVDLFDSRIRHRLPTDNWGMFETTLSASYYTKYEYEGHEGGVQDALGMQNARTGIVPPVPKLKSALKLAWFLDQHSATATANYTHHVEFDDRVSNLLTGIQPSRLIEAQTIVNTQYTYMFDEYSVSVGVNNLFDELPQLLPVLGGFESRLHQPWGRQFWLSLDWTPGF